MQILIVERGETCPSSPPAAPLVLGTSATLNLEQFPELGWISFYLTRLYSLQTDRDRLTSEMDAIAATGDVYRDCWIEPYVKTKNGKHYPYHQLRWLTGERKPSGQPKVKTKHLSHHAVGAVRAAIARGQQVVALEQERQRVEAEIERLRHLVRGTGRRLHRGITQNFNLQEGDRHDQ